MVRNIPVSYGYLTVPVPLGTSLCFISIKVKLEKYLFITIFYREQFLRPKGNKNRSP
jgi:hypothetical protein